ncbi:MAG: hypothetical protein PHX18_04715 [Candidatus Gastranaerophilales bacterium]|nr:hypothetical protein [Candidatus Gastranaerophilales bacterium]
MKKYKRWYDYDPTLLEVIEILRNYQDELKAQAAIFLEKIEAQAGKETVDRFYSMVKPVDGGKRWYDKDPVISKAIELLRVVPSSVQKSVAENFMKSLESTGLTREEIKASIEKI